MSSKPIKQQTTSTMRHKYSVGDKVRVVNKQHALYDCEGVIVQLMRQTFVEPGYYARINGIVAALSERSLEKLQPSSEIDNSLST